MDKPKVIAITKLIIVPIKIYSASSLLFCDLILPNRKIDFAAIKNMGIHLKSKMCNTMGYQKTNKYK